MDVMVTVYPEEGNFPAIARALLDAADHPNQVRSVSHPRSGFQVPEEVYDRFAAAMGQDAQDEASSTHQEDQDAQTNPRKRRPGRPRKNDDASEEE